MLLLLSFVTKLIVTGQDNYPSSSTIAADVSLLLFSVSVLLPLCLQQDNYPSMSTIAADLSPFYLARARTNVAYWKRQRAPALELGGMDGTGVWQCA
jgi:hypothetical protein